MTLGTPKIEDIYKDGRHNSSEIIYKFGKVEKLKWKDILPKATDDAIDLLEKMLKFDPDKRISVEEAMKHKYFDDLPKDADEKVEPVSKFDFEFEDQDLNTNELRDLILYEIMLYHDQSILDEYDKAKEQYIKGEKRKDRHSVLKSGSKNKRTGSKSSRSNNG
jgi:mitogen-activated protein kinase 7